MASIFAIFLVFLSVVSGLIWLLDAKVFAPKRQLAFESAQKQLGEGMTEEVKEKLLRQPFLAETAQSIFPVVLAITIFRSFIYEPFQIPSGSMKPTLLVGDFILVEKFAYGIKDPVTRNELVATGKPQRGDVAVFKYPLDPMVDYIKRVVGVPGDIIYYKNKTLFIKPSCEREPDKCDRYNQVNMELLSKNGFTDNDTPVDVLKEDLLGTEHNILINNEIKNHFNYYQQSAMPKDHWRVPEGHYFMMGDNRDNSGDSRYWGFVPEENFVGRAVFIWTSFEFERQPEDWLPTWVPTGVRFERLGSFE